MKFYQSSEFKMQELEWDEILKNEGFIDQETQSGNLKKPDDRTIGFKNKDKICDFFLTLDRLMNFYPEMPAFERRVLQLYSQGVFLSAIVKDLKTSRISVKRIIYRYRGLILALQRMETMSHFPHPLEAESLASEGAHPSGKRCIRDKAA